MMPFLTDACDVRFFFIAQRLAFVKFRKPRGKDYIGNVALGGEQTILTEQAFLADYNHLPYFAKMLHLSRDIMEQAGSVILSVDWIMNNDGFYFNEMATAETGLTKHPEEIRGTVFDQLSRVIHNNHAYE